MDPVTPTIIKRPLLSLQCDWEEALRVNEGSAWVSCRELGKSSKHGKLTFVNSSENAHHKIKASDGFRVDYVTNRSIVISHEAPNCKCEFYAPTKVFTRLKQKSAINSIDVNAELGISSSDSKVVLLWDTIEGNLLRSLEGHVFDVYCCKFLPGSGFHALSAGADMQIKVWEVDTNRCASTLIGHTAAITDISVVSQRKNVVTVSKDGTARLWDCEQFSAIHVISTEIGSINCCAIEQVGVDLGTPEHAPDNREVDTEGRLLVLGSESGKLKGIGLQSHKEIFQHSSDSAINCCCIVSNNAVVFGTQNGKICVFDIRARLPVTLWEESNSPVLCMITVEKGVFCGRADGTVSYIAFDSDRSIQLTGPDFDSVTCIAHHGNAIFTGSRDGNIRRYDVTL